MNTETGQVYRSVELADQARERGEPIAQVSAKVADMVEAGERALNRAERRRLAREDRRAAKRRGVR